MALFIRQEEPGSQLKSKIAAELRARTKVSGAAAELDDQSKNAAILKNQHQTSTLGVVITIIVLIIIGVGFYLIAT